MVALRRSRSGNRIFHGKFGNGLHHYWHPHSIADLHCGVFKLETYTHLDDAAVNELCSQLPLVADYEGEGSHGSMFTLYFKE